VAGGQRECCSACDASRKNRDCRQRLAYDRRGGAHVYGKLPGARTVEEFSPAANGTCDEFTAVHGSCGKLTADGFSIVPITFHGQAVDAALSAARGVVPAFTAGHWVNEIRFLPEMDCDHRARRKTEANAVGFGFELRKPIGQVEVFVRKRLIRLRPKIRKRLRAHAILRARNLSRLRCILLIASACLFPAVG